MKLEIVLTQEQIETIVVNFMKYLKEHPKEAKGFAQSMGDVALDVLSSRRVLKKLASLYRKFNAELNFSYRTELVE